MRAWDSNATPDVTIIRDNLLNQSAWIVLDTLLPSEANPALRYGLSDTDFTAFWSDLERTALPAWRWGFQLALWVANWIAPLLIRRLPPLILHDRLTPEAPKRYAFYRVSLVDKKSRDNFYPDSLLLDYGTGPRNPAYGIERLIRDYLVQPYSANPDLLLGKAYLAAGRLRLPSNFSTWSGFA